VHIARIVGPGEDETTLGFRFARLGNDLVERRGLGRFRARTRLTYAALSVSRVHLRTARDLIRRAFETAYEMGDLTYAAFSCHHLISNLLAAGDPLADVEREVERCLEFARRTQFSLETDVLTTQLAYVRMLRGNSMAFGRLDNAQFEEQVFEQRLQTDPGLSFAASWYWIRKLQARLAAGDDVTADEAAVNARNLLGTAPSIFRTMECVFYEALGLAARHGVSNEAVDAAALAALRSHHERLLKWAKGCPENFANRAALIGAEIARIERRDLDAQRLYDVAVRTARDNGFVHLQALAAELAGHFHAARDFDTIARAYLREASQAYQLWGADGKVRQLAALHPHLREPPARSLSSTIGAPLHQLDFATIIKVSQRVSTEIVVEDLVDAIMHAAIERGGAQRGLLLLEQRGTYRIAAEAAVRGDSVAIDLRHDNVTPDSLPESIFLYVTRTHETVLMNDAAEGGPFATDAYLRVNNSRSVLCLPLINKARLIGVLYLENALSTHIFSPERISLLRLLGSIAAASLENARLFRELQQREARLRRLFNSNIIGIFNWNLDGRILDANDAFLRIMGYDADDLACGGMHWTDMKPGRYTGDDEIMKEMLATGLAPPFEDTYVRKDGQRVPVLIGAALFDDATSEGVAFVLDLSEQKHAESDARDSLRRYHEVQMRLSDANRVASIGQLSASIVHEVNQPLAGILTNAGVVQRQLAARPPDVDASLNTVQRMIRDVNRANDVIGRLRALFARSSSEPELVDLNDAVCEVIDMSRSNLRSGGIRLEMNLASDLPRILGDRVQLQQVVMNLMRNAVDAMKEGDGAHREIVVATERIDGDQMRLAVTDRGPGIDTCDLEKVFEAFYTSKQDGMGIGLSLSRSIIEHHGGRLWAARNEGPGVTFFFTLPTAGSATGDEAAVLPDV
jgi:PAS domain S-box-containing protein